MKLVYVRRGIVVLLATVVLAWCAESKEKGARLQEVIELSNEQDEDETIRFKDGDGDVHEVEVLSQVPEVKYEYSRLVDEDGLKYYKDESGKIISELGIDVSEYQQSVDFKQVKEAGFSFVIIRVGYRGFGEEGKLVEDAMFRQHIEAAKDAGLKLGVYFFSQAVTEEEALEEAEFVKARIKDYNITYPVAFDTEAVTEDTSRTEELSREQFTENCAVFCDAVEKAGYKSAIYANLEWMTLTLQLEKLVKYNKWYADYESLPQIPYEFHIWQYTEDGEVPGVEGKVDLSIAFSP